MPPPPQKLTWGRAAPYEWLNTSHVNRIHVNPITEDTMLKDVVSRGEPAVIVGSSVNTWPLMRKKLVVGTVLNWFGKQKLPRTYTSNQTIELHAFSGAWAKRAWHNWRASSKRQDGRTFIDFFSSIAGEGRYSHSRYPLGVEGLRSPDDRAPLLPRVPFPSLCGQLQQVLGLRQLEVRSHQ